MNHQENWKRPLCMSFEKKYGGQSYILAISDENKTVFVERDTPNNIIRGIERWLEMMDIEYEVVPTNPPDWSSTA